METIRDIKGLVPLPEHWWWVALLLVMAAGVAAAWWYLWRRQEMETAPLGPPPTPYEIAVRELQQLLDEKLMERGELDAFYTRLSDIVRRYLEGRFHLRAPERTTEEFLYEVSRDDSLVQEHKDLLGRFLQESDLVKFARFRPGLEDMQRVFAAAQQFVEDTRPVVEQQEEAVAQP
jgi:hypothetical protein